MKMKNALTVVLTALAFVIVGCEDKKTAVPHDHDGDGKPDHAPGEHGKRVPHDHDGDGKPDHGPGEHGKHVPHDHDGDGIPDHGPDEHDAHKHGGHDHPKKVAGPNGGKILTSANFKNELFVTADRKIQITFLDKDNKPVAVAAQEVNIVGGDRSDPTMLSFSKAKDGMSLISSGKLPDGNNIPIIITVKTSPEAAAARASMSLDLSDCPSCDYKEYACTCDHHHGDHKH